MDIDTLREYCLSFPRASENLQWEDELCFNIAGKIFVILSLESVPPKICFKCRPEKFAELTERRGIVPAPYVGRYKWVLVEGLDLLPDDELRELIRESYDAVAAKARWPRPQDRTRAGRKGGRKPGKQRKRSGI